MLTRQEEESASLQLDADVLAAFRATGADWRRRVNEVLREWVRRQRGIGRRKPRRSGADVNLIW